MGYGAYHETVESAREAMRSTRAVNAGMFARNEEIAHGGQKGIHPMLDIRRPNGRPWRRGAMCACIFIVSLRSLRGVGLGLCSAGICEKRNIHGAAMKTYAV